MDEMDKTILGTIKNLLGIQTEDTSFDQDILININSVFSILYQIGVGNKRSYFITSVETWDEVFKDYIEVIDMIKNYTYMKVRLYFDPPSSSFVLDSLTKQIKELEWRIQFEIECSDQFKNIGMGNDYISDDDAIPNYVIKDLWNKGEN